MLFFFSAVQVSRSGSVIAIALLFLLLSVGGTWDEAVGFVGVLGCVGLSQLFWFGQLMIGLSLVLCCILFSMFYSGVFAVAGRTCAIIADKQNNKGKAFCLIVTSRPAYEGLYETLRGDIGCRNGENSGIAQSCRSKFRKRRDQISPIKSLRKALERACH